jgi:aldose 1-epimerase
MKPSLIQWPTLKNREGMTVTFCNVGASIYEIVLPNGQRVTLSNQDKESFLNSPFYYGKTIGRHSGRLVVPHYQIDGKKYPVKPFRSEKTSLHGGKDGLSTKTFTIINQDHEHLTFQYISLEGEGDFPGILTVEVTYRLTEDHALIIDHRATTTKPTICNLTNHIYFHFASQPCQLKDVTLRMNSDSYLDIDGDFLIQGIKPSKDSPYSFKHASNLGHRLQQFESHPFGGIDHYFFLNRTKAPMIEVNSEQCPYRLNVHTTYPGVVMYTFNNEEIKDFIEGDHDYFHRGFTLECQLPPGGIHHPGMIDSVLRPGVIYQHQTQYQFVKK